MKDAVIYSRVSTEEQDYERQINDIKSTFGNEFNIREVFSEKQSGAIRSSKREAFINMGAYIEKHSIKNVIVWEISRLGRKLVDVVNILDDFAEKGICVLTHQNGFRTLLPDGSRDSMALSLTALLSSFAENELHSIKQRTKSGLLESKRKGGANGGPFQPYGFISINKKLQINEEEANVVKNIFKWYLSGIIPSEIAKRLNAQEVKTAFNKRYSGRTTKTRGGRTISADSFHWSSARIYSMLTNSVYKGQRTHSGHLLPMEKSLILIEPDDWDKVQKILSSRNNMIGNNSKYINILQGKIVCGKCGDLSYYMHRRRNLKDNAYKCLSHRYTSEISCNNPGVNIDLLNSLLAHVLYNERPKNNELLKALMARVLDLVSKKFKLDGTAKKLESERDRLNYMFQKDRIDESSYDNRYKLIMKKVERLGDELQMLLDEKTEIKLSIEEIKKGKIKPPKYSADTLKNDINVYVKKVIVYEADIEEYRYLSLNKQDVAIRILIKLINGNELNYILLNRTKLFLKDNQVVKVNLDKIPI